MNELNNKNTVNQRIGLSSLIKQLLLALVRAYQYVVSPWLGPSCRYLPCCSEYARQALEIHGPWKGSWLAVRRISRCHPLGASGYDPVPEALDGAVTDSHDRHGGCHGH